MIFKKNWAQKLKDFIDRHPITILLVIFVFFISSFITISQGVTQGIEIYKNTFNWRGTEYSKINTIQAGMNIDKFNDTFGVPLYSRVSENGYKEFIYRKRDYWIQAVASVSGTVDFYSITACDQEFKPTMIGNSINADITLNKSTFDSISRSAGQSPGESKYYSREATANSEYYDSYYYGNPSAYKTTFVGINDACSEPELVIEGNKSEYEESDLENREVRNFREKATVDSYGETAPFVDASKIIRDFTSIFNDKKDESAEFQFGVDRIQVRTLVY